MGPLALSMPLPIPVVAAVVGCGTTTMQRNNNVNAVMSSTQLLGGHIKDDIALSQRISARLARHMGWPIFVLCELLGGHGIGGGGDGAHDDDDDDARRRTAALVEREVSCILMPEKGGGERPDRSARHHNLWV